MAKHDIIPITLGALAGTFSVNYPAGRLPEHYLGGEDHMIISHSSRPLFSKSKDFKITFGASNISITLETASFAAGTQLFLHVDRADTVGETPDGDPVDLANPDRMDALHLVKINLGAPAAADADGAVKTQACTAADGLATGFDGDLVADDAAVFDVPRNVVAAWTGTAVLTVTGTDEYGAAIVESSASGTSFTGKKAFKTVTGVAVSADVTGLTVGTGVVMGLPVYLGDVVDVLKESVDGAAPTAGTVVAGVIAAATATTGDVRGTYAGNQAPNGSRHYELIIASRAPAYRGGAQFAG